MARLAMIFALDYKYGGWTQLLCSKHTHMMALVFLIVPTEIPSAWLRGGPENSLFSLSAFRVVFAPRPLARAALVALTLVNHANCASSAHTQT